MATAWRDTINRRYRQWVDWRLPASRHTRLNNRRLFVFPTRAGFAYIGLLVVLWLVATNYENNLVFAATALLGSLLVIAIFHTFLNLSGVTVEAGRSFPGFCGGHAEIEITLSQTSKRHRESISLAYASSDSVTVSLPGSERTSATLAVEATHRGWLDPGRVTIATVYPLGLIRAWTILDIKTSALVYPRPIRAEAQLQSVTAPGEDSRAAMPGREDFRSLDRYQRGEPLTHIAWKHFARERGLYTKHYSDPVDERVWLDWDAFPGLATEARLSALCEWLLRLQGERIEYGLRLPGVEITPAKGDSHRDRILKALALYDTPAVVRSQP